MWRRTLFSIFGAGMTALFASFSGCTLGFDSFEPCAAGQKVCGEVCVETSIPQFGCAAAECTPCALANASATCEAGACAVGGCQGSFENCDGDDANGCEVDTDSDPSHCSACGAACALANATAGCADGSCVIEACDPGFDDCDGNPPNGCEVMLSSDPDHCGDCATSCPPFQSCVMGNCTLECPDGFADCDMDVNNGCETQLGTDSDCAMCGDTCNFPNSQSSCTAGMCQIDTCDNGFDDCDGQTNNGCEADLDGSAATCGDCNTACPTGANGTAVCNNGNCAFNCNGGFEDCDGNLANGCETPTSGDPTNCGGCGVTCNFANGAGNCNMGVCEITSCNAPFDDCDNNPMNGCETNTGTNASSCGGCGNVCNLANATEGCMNGMCTIASCNGAFEDCDGMAGNGCEVNTNTDPLHCSGCGVACPAGPANTVTTCVNAVCGTACAAGFQSCDGNMANGCETSTDANVDNCGACGRACAGGAAVASKSCSGGVCNSTCAPGFANCTTPMAPNMDNGCETNVNANDNNCGGCANSCSDQGGAMNDLECDGGPATQKYCGCSSTQECQGAGVAMNNAACGAQGICSCGPAGMLSACHQGEACAVLGGVAACSCNGGAACGAGQTCCDTPGGCFTLASDPQNCGACGHACAAGFTCNVGVCACDGDADCNAGTGATFTCNAGGLCVCGGTTCGIGQRCQPNGQCG